jgi:phosphoribosylformylglycinamidine cyclo-ligase
LEIYTEEKNADEIISIARGYSIDAQVIGRVEKSKGERLAIKTSSGFVNYEF